MSIIKEKQGESAMRFNIEKLENFTIMPNNHLQDKNLSLQAKGLLSTFYYLPNNWEYTMKGLCTITNTGIKKIRSILFELELWGYLTRDKIRTEKGRIDYEYKIYIKPKKPDYKNTQIYKKLQAKGIITI